MNILILGGDGYLGWPTAMHLSSLGHQVTVVDNYMRRHACDQLDTPFLYAVPNLLERARRWLQISGNEIKVKIADLAIPVETRALFDGSAKADFYVEDSEILPPHAVVHYAEQPSAPYSQYDYKLGHRTLLNNLSVTNNLIWAIRDFSPSTHIVKLGTMGEYGTPNIDIEEGWLEVEHKGRSQKFLYPRQAGSLYHTTKVMDTDLLWFAVRMWGLKVTDLMQGPVYGLETDQTILDNDLRTLFNYDEIFGTIINRFVVQAVAGYPLTVYGKGGQTRGYLNIKDTLQCIEKAIDTPAADGELRIFNQITETFSANDIACHVQRVGSSLGLNVDVNHIENPRKEAEEHYYNPTYQGLKDIGVKSTFLTDEILGGIMEQVLRLKDAIRTDIIFRGVKW
jgi:UDP-sulfoquinovose synthase